ncbi:hypothetical protein vBPFY1MI_124 [Pseudomonas phage vB_PF_Y1-MI]|nr:hypothetical protein vBPFY1MI_124 [Pseudomonas phage vB_PF_Y1-MI]
MKLLNWIKSEYIVDSIFLNQIAFLYFIMAIPT